MPNTIRIHRVRNGIEHPAGRRAGRDPARDVLPRLAGIAHSSGQTGRSRDPVMNESFTIRSPFWRDAKTSTRDARATQMKMLRLAAESPSSPRRVFDRTGVSGWQSALPREL